MTLFDSLYPYQARFVLSPLRRKIWLSARQVGKSTAMSGLLCRKALGVPGGLALCVSTGQRAAQEIIKKCERWAAAVAAASKGRLGYQSSADCVRFSNGSRVLSLPNNPAALRGYTAKCVCVDEAAYVDGLEEVMQAIAPTLTRDPEAELVLASTPAGRNGCFYRMCEAAKSDPEWHFQVTTIEDAKADGLDVDVDRLRSLCPDPEAFGMEYMCRFAESYGAFLDLSQLEWYDGAPPDGAVPYLGMDIGSRHDRTAFATLFAKGQEFWLDGAETMDRASYASQLARLKALHAEKGYAGGYVDQNGIGGPVAEFANRDVSPRIRGFTWTASNKTPAYEDFRAAVMSGKMRFARRLRTLLEADFANVRRLVGESGTVSFEAGRDSNGHSDVASAAVLALRAAKEIPASFAEPQAWSFPSAFGAHGGLF